MPGSMERPKLHVEGPDDKHAVRHLLTRNGIDYDREQLPPTYPKIQEIDSVEKVLEGMSTAIQVSGGLPIGFVLDADSPLVDRWGSVRSHLTSVGMSAPQQPPVDGFIEQCAKYGTVVGVWLMPDNQQDGKLEHLLKSLIDEKDSLIDHANSATDTAKQLRASFSAPDHIKAVIHSWLAWQPEPGLRYGTAIRARYFGHGSPAANSFVAWFKRLYGIA